MSLLLTVMKSVWDCTRLQMFTTESGNTIALLSINASQWNWKPNFQFPALKCLYKIDCLSNQKAIEDFCQNATDGSGHCDSDIRMIEEGVQHLESPCVGVGPWGSLDIYSPITVAASGFLSLITPLHSTALEPGPHTSFIFSHRNVKVFCTKKPSTD